MSQLHEALKLLSPRDFGDVPTSELEPFFTDLFSKCELITNSVPPPPNGTPYETSQRSRTDANAATSLTDLTVSDVRRPQVQAEHEELQKSWGKPLKLSKQDAALGISVFKMAGNDRHGAWFARTSVHEGLGFSKWKRAMKREFPESLAVQGGPGEGNVRGIGGDKRLEEIEVSGLGKLEVLQLSAQFPGPTSPREFITLLITSENALTEASKVGDIVPRHYIVVSIPVTHPEAPMRDGFVRGQYESVEIIREIPLSSGDNADPESNPVEWIMITRSDPGGGIPRFMVERNTPSSIVQDAGKFLQWACTKEDVLPREEELHTVEPEKKNSIDQQRAFSMTEANGLLAGVGTSIADDPRPVSFRRPSQMAVDKADPGIMQSIANTVESYLPDSMRPPQRTNSQSSTSSSASSISDASFASADEGVPGDSSVPGREGSVASIPFSLADPTGQAHSRHTKELEKIEQRRQQAIEKLKQAQEKQAKETEEASLKNTKELEKANEKHERERKKQEEKYAKEMQKLEAKREKEEQKLLAKQQKEAEKNEILKAQRERDEWKEKADFAEKENKLLQEQIQELQKYNTALVAWMGKSEEGIEMLARVREEVEGNGDGRKRASSRASATSSRSRQSTMSGAAAVPVHPKVQSNLALPE